MHELAQMSYNQYVSCPCCILRLTIKHREDFVDIVAMLDKRLNDKGKYWRHVYKSLTVLEYLLHSGSPKVAQYFRDNIYLIKTLTEFQHIDDDGRDVGSDVRVRARELSRLLGTTSVWPRRGSGASKCMTAWQESESAKATFRRRGIHTTGRNRKSLARRNRTSSVRYNRASAMKQSACGGLRNREKAVCLTTPSLSRVTSSTSQSTSPSHDSFSHSSHRYRRSSRCSRTLLTIPPRCRRSSLRSTRTPNRHSTSDVAGGIRATASGGGTATAVLRASAPSRATSGHAAVCLPAASACSTEDCVRLEQPFAANNPFGQPTAPSPLPTPQLPHAGSPVPSAASTPALVQGRPLSSASVSSHASSLPPRTPVSLRAEALSAALGSAGPGGVDTSGMSDPQVRRLCVWSGSVARRRHLCTL
ncbi:hypothetical protein BC826DRAFT_1003128, partial [Russula brevipes]